jgi:DNA-cytosine methyltransferase
MSKTTASLFTGGGGFEQGAMMAGYTPVWGVEIRPDIAAWAECNTPGLKVIVSNVAAVDYASLPKVDHLHASPSCKKASIANSEGGECPEDIEAAKAVCRAIEAVKPHTFTLENVWGYREFEAFKLIIRSLREAGYFVDWWHLNSANYGVPQTRKRLILIARLDRQPTKPQPTHSDTPDMFGYYQPWVGWLEAIADLVDSLPDSEFAPWQLERLPAELKTFIIDQVNYSTNTTREANEPIMTVSVYSSKHPAPRAFLVNKSADKYGDGVNYAEGRAFSVVANSQGRYKAFLLNRNKSERDDHYKPSTDPAYTVCIESGGRQRAFLTSDNYGSPNDTGKERILQLYNPDDPAMTVRAGKKTTMKAGIAGRVVKMTPRALARFQSLPDNYELPEQNGLACEIIGNMVPPLLAKAICESLGD